MRNFILSLALLTALGAPALANSGTAQKATPAAARTTPAVVPATAWRVDSSASKVAVSETVSGYSFKFDNWNANLRFDPNNLAGSKAIVTIEMGSARTGETGNDLTLQREWMNANQHPRAVFETTAFRALGANRYEAPATLTVRGRVYTVLFTFTAAITGNQAVVTGETKLDRTIMGFTMDPTFDWISKVITVSVSLRANKA